MVVILPDPKLKKQGILSRPSALPREKERGEGEGEAKGIAWNCFYVELFNLNGLIKSNGQYSLLSSLIISGALI
jgi:hypothetical protein